MCQRGTLRLECVGTRVGFLYRLSRQGPPQYDWEQTICDSLPSRPTTIDDLDEALRKHKDTIGDQIGDYLQDSGLFHDNPVRAARENLGSGAEWTMLAGALMGVGGWALDGPLAVPVVGERPDRRVHRLHISADCSCSVDQWCRQRREASMR